MIENLYKEKKRCEEVLKKLKRERLFLSFFRVFDKNLKLEKSYLSVLQLISHVIILACILNLGLFTLGVAGEIAGIFVLLGLSVPISTGLTIHSYKNYSKNGVIDNAKEEIQLIEKSINKQKTDIESNKKTNDDIKGTSEKNVTVESKNLSDKIKELKEYKESIVLNKEQNKEQSSKKR